MAKRQKRGEPILSENSFMIDKCEACGFVSYCVIARCPQCGNMIIKVEEVDQRTWVTGAVKENLAEMKK